MYELFAFAESLHPIAQGVLAGFVLLLAVFLFRGFYLWLTGANLILEELRTLNANLIEIKGLQNKDFEIQRRIYANTEISNDNLAEIQNNTEQLVFIWEE